MIPFPRMHIAESVMNRIYNALDDTGPMFPSFNPSPTPPPDPIGLGMEIDQQTQKPIEPVAQTGDLIADTAAEESIFGGSPFAGALEGMMQR